MRDEPSLWEVKCRMKRVIPLIVLALIIVPAYVVAAKSDSTSKPSIVLVHGAWADASSWSGVISRLQDDGYTVYAPPNPLRGLASDSAYLASFLATISGPIVLVGHSYGGVVISNAATGNPNVKALVFVDAFVPDQGESLMALASAPPPPGQPGSCLADATHVFNFVPISGDVDVYIKQSVFPSCFANDLKPDRAAVLASEQRPLAGSVLNAISGAPAWKTIPSWYLVGKLDLVIPPFAQIFMAQRAHSTIAFVNAAHPAMISHPEAATDLIEQAAQSLQGNGNISSQQALVATSL
jgi:pimeloyl-ACP methyl ester carboxylesterase